MSPSTRRETFCDGAFSILIPEAWFARELDDVVELESPDGTAAIHVSVFARDEPRVPEDGEALWFVEEFARGSGVNELKAAEKRTDGGLVASASYAERLETGRSVRWEVLAVVNGVRAAVVSCNDGGSDDRGADVRHIVSSIVLSESWTR